MELPSHPQDDDSSPGRTPSPKTSPATIVVIVVIGVIVLLVVVLHLTGVVGPTKH